MDPARDRGRAGPRAHAQDHSPRHQARERAVRRPARAGGGFRHRARGHRGGDVRTDHRHGNRRRQPGLHGARTGIERSPDGSPGRHLRVRRPRLRGVDGRAAVHGPQRGAARGGAHDASARPALASSAGHSRVARGDRASLPRQAAGRPLSTRRGDRRAPRRPADRSPERDGGHHPGTSGGALEVPCFGGPCPPARPAGLRSAHGGRLDGISRQPCAVRHAGLLPARDRAGRRRV